MLKVGFIDYYLDEWHANEYPGFIDKASNGRYKVCYAYGKIDSPIGGISNAEWAKKHGVELVDTIDELVEKSDRIIVLSPDNPEMHEELCDIPLKSGKLVYVDKTFAPDRATAERIFANADKHNTRCYSSSALRFAAELKNIDKSKIHTIYSEGSGTYEMYSIHQIEPIVCLMQCRAKKVMYTGDAAHPSMIIEFEDGRRAHMHHGFEVPFRITVTDKDNNAEVNVIESDFFALFTEALIEFFDSGEIAVPHEQTIDVIAVREAGIRAMENPFTWVEV